MSGEIRREIVIKNEEGLHARPASTLVSAIQGLDCEVFLSNPTGEEVDAKSILGILMLAAERGSKLGVRAAGPDAQKAVDAIFRILGESP